MKNELKHTPGPWVIGNNHDASSEDFIIRQGDDLDALAIGSAFVDHIGLPLDEARHNAALIAAAPELLEALAWFADELQGIIHQICPHGVPLIVSEAHDKARAAIARAKGEA